MNKRKFRGLALGILGSLLLSFNIYAESYAAVKGSTANIVETPNLKSEVVTEVNKDETVKVIKQVEDWYEVDINDSTAYIDVTDVDIYKVKAKINVDNVELKAYPKSDDTTIRTFPKDKVVSVLYKVGDWYNVSMSDKPVFGFIHESKLEDPLLYLAPTKDIEDVERIKLPKKLSKGNQVVEYAKQFVGNPYIYGGTSLTNGTDCSGFTQQVIKSAGVSINRSSRSQYSGSGVKVSKNSLQPGDLLYYGYNGRVSHTALYAGNGQIIHASNSKTGIINGKAFSGRGKPFIGAKRVL